MKVVDERGRKFTLVLAAIPFWVLVAVAAFLKAAVPALDDLELAALSGAAAGMSGLATIYVGGNVIHRAQEAKIAEATGTDPAGDEPEPEV